MTKGRGTVTETSPSRNPGDVGRRVAHRRGELGLSTDEVAERAGMDRGFLEYLESQPAQLTSSTVVCIVGFQVQGSRFQV